ncbi:MAG: tyrosine-protein phosphatase [Runella sp.]
MPFSFLKRSRTTSQILITPSLKVDIHAHVLPGLDNGPETVEESVSLLQEMAQAGVKKVIATPHIMGEYYANTPEQIKQVYQCVQSEILKRCIPLQLEVAAEYYLDVSFISTLENNGPLLTFGKRYLLIETGIVGLPSILWEAIRLIHQQKLIPVLAHPERYLYLQQNFDIVHQLHHQGVLFQVNLPSWETPHLPTRLLADRLAQEGLVSFVGSNVHHLRDWTTTREALRNKSYLRTVESGLLNQKI